MSKIAMAVDLDYCVGCFSCESACKFVNRLSDGTSWLRVTPKDIISEEYRGRLVMDRFPIPITVEMCFDCPDRLGCLDNGCEDRSKGLCGDCPNKSGATVPVCASTCVGQALYVGDPDAAIEWAEGRRSVVFTA